jgi:hypothetical protein
MAKDGRFACPVCDDRKVSRVIDVRVNGGSKRKTSLIRTTFAGAGNAQTVTALRPLRLLQKNQNKVRHLC